MSVKKQPLTLYKSYLTCTVDHPPQINLHSKKMPPNKQLSEKEYRKILKAGRQTVVVRHPDDRDVIIYAGQRAVNPMYSGRSFPVYLLFAKRYHENDDADTDPNTTGWLLNMERRTWVTGTREPENGHWTYTLRRNSITYGSVSRGPLLLYTFISDPPEPGMGCRRINKNIGDSLKNLKWASQREITLNAERFKHTGSSTGMLAEKDGVLLSFDSISGASKELQIEIGYIRRVLSGKRDDFCGWRFRYDYMEDDGSEWASISDDGRELGTSGRVRQKVKGGYVELKSIDKGTYQTVTVHGKLMRRNRAMILLHGSDEDRKRFLEDPTLEVDHKDNNPRNDSISNLQLLTPQEHAQKTHGVQVRVTRLSDGAVRVFATVTDTADYFKINISTMFASLYDERPPLKGFVFEKGEKGKQPWTVTTDWVIPSTPVIVETEEDKVKRFRIEEETKRVGVDYILRTYFDVIS
jgi:hypothetical protein